MIGLSKFQKENGNKLIFFNETLICNQIVTPVWYDLLIRTGVAVKILKERLTIKSQVQNESFLNELQKCISDTFEP